MSRATKKTHNSGQTASSCAAESLRTRSDCVTDPACTMLRPILIRFGTKDTRRNRNGIMTGTLRCLTRKAVDARMTRSFPNESAPRLVDKTACRKCDRKSAVLRLASRVGGADWRKTTFPSFRDIFRRSWAAISNSARRLAFGERPAKHCVNSILGKVHIHGL